MPDRFSIYLLVEVNDWAFSFPKFVVQYFGNGAYGVTANTGACGALDKGSIPFRHPEEN